MTILVFSDSSEEHDVYLSLLRANGLIVRPGMCVFGVSLVDFIGHRITADGILPLPDKVARSKITRPPTTIKEQQAFLGLANYYHRFIPTIAMGPTDASNTAIGAAY